MVALGWLLKRGARKVSSLSLVLSLSTAAALADWREDLPGARAVGTGQFKWFGFSIYEARLWSPNARPTLDNPFALELTYRREIKRGDLVEVSLEEIRRLGGEGLPGIAWRVGPTKCTKPLSMWSPARASRGCTCRARGVASM